MQRFRSKSLWNVNVLFFICFVNALSASVFNISSSIVTFSSFHLCHQLLFTLYPHMKLIAKQNAPSLFNFWNIFISPSTRSAAAASSDITFQISCIRYPAWISDSRNNSYQLDWLSDENCQVVKIINAFVSSKYLLLSSFLQLYWRTRSFLRSAHWHWHVKSSTGTL